MNRQAGMILICGGNWFHQKGLFFKKKKIRSIFFLNPINLSISYISINHHQCLSLYFSFISCHWFCLSEPTYLLNFAGEQEPVNYNIEIWRKWVPLESWWKYSSEIGIRAFCKTSLSFAWYVSLSPNRVLTDLTLIPK